MGLKDIDIKETYWSGEDNLIESFYIPCLNNSITYDRAVGFFNSSILNYISEGLYRFIINDGKMRIVCSTKLSNKDINSINEGYEIKNVLFANLSNHINQYLLDKDKPNVRNLCWLIKNNRLEIKICIRSLHSFLETKEDNTLFHEKFGIFKDREENIISFLGSINESLGGWMFNEESFEVSYSWEDTLRRRVLEKVERFERLWRGLANEVITYDFPTALKNKLIEAAPDEPVDSLAYCAIRKNTFFNKFTPRDCQFKAFNKFKESNYICMFQMATGAGKTKAALYSYRNVDGWKFLLILVPGAELVLQWETEVKSFFTDAYILKCGSDFSNWKKKLVDIIQAKIPDRTIVISTYDSAITEFSMDKWTGIIPFQFGLICDEAHNLGSKQTQKIMDLKARYRIGLSATPSRNFDEEGTEKILGFFNNKVYEFSIKDAIREKYLVEYEYKVFPCLLNKEEWYRYFKLSKEISKIKSYTTMDNKNINTNYKEDLLRKKYMERAEILKTASNKLDIFPDIIDTIPKDIRILIYADSLYHLQGYAATLERMGRDYFIYTGDKDSKVVRPKMLEEFRLGVRKVLLAINCLDEGIDIPVCDAAIFISSSTSERQFIQRRGRVLRKSTGKQRAYIYDFLVIPIFNLDNEYEKELAKQIVLKEYNRINIIAEDAINGIKVQEDLDKILSKHGLSIYNY
ncbi:MAG: DEAD/DEAH box helicase family protein [Ignavibacteriales bacterium]